MGGIFLIKNCKEFLIKNRMEFNRKW